MTKICAKCGVKKELGEYRVRRRQCKLCEKEYNKKYNTLPETKARHKEWNAQPRAKRNKYLYDQRIKKQVFDHYGPCTCCGESNLYFLMLDHINNDGAEHRRQMRNKGTHIYPYVIKNNFPTNLQTLCANCNWGKFTSGIQICPHKTEISS